MYSIERTAFGLVIKFDGFIKSDEMLQYKREIKSVLLSLPERFGIVMDMRTCKPLPKESQDILNADPELVASRLTRSVTVVDSALTSMQFKRLAVASKVSDSKRFIDVSKIPDWEPVAERWIVDGEFDE